MCEKYIKFNPLRTKYIQRNGSLPFPLPLCFIDLAALLKRYIKCHYKMPAEIKAIHLIKYIC